ncbi:hypothetical protein PBAL39_18499 [Pedobacter sp. BAL39]|uniref:glycoside hydrolase family 95-like protein n=1 Tax=Pedobacter sp. BAL39 TaxID=391596 RepID=UPI0001559507|nr:hypothetical protein [Pedobacter sp. BAL39]EDM36892.1 hypothetical protein PBAL39_18499 [Pedobacter sp. BAL39]
MKWTFTILALFIFAGNSEGQTGKPLFSWAEFMARQSMRWDSVSTNPNTGLLLGNGLLNTNIYKESENAIRFDIGRSDLSGIAMPLSGGRTGKMLLKTRGKITAVKLELDLYNATAKGIISTTSGTIQFSSFVPANGNVVWIKAVGNRLEKNIRWQFVAEKQAEAVVPVIRKVLNDQVCVQSLGDNAGFATAWRSVVTPAESTMLVAVGYDPNGMQDELKEAQNGIKLFTIAKLPVMQEAHRKWWHQYYQQNFASVPDQRVESFYWIHRYYYALASKKKGNSLPPAMSYLPDLTNTGDQYSEWLNQLFDGLAKSNVLHDNGSMKDSLPAVALTIPQMLLQNGEGKLKVFPAIPASWKNVSFDKLSAGSNFLVSAKKENDTTSFIKIYSLKGDSCQLQTDMKVNMVTSDKRSELSFTVFETGGKMNISFTTTPGETIFLSSGYEESKRMIVPVKPVLYANWRWGLK